MELYSDEWFKTVHAHVNATSFEQFCIWKEYKDRFDWISNPSGKLLTLGMVDKRPTCVSLNTAKVGGKVILFFEGTSMLCDHQLINDFIREKCPQVALFVDAQNFHNAVRSKNG